MKDKTLSTLLMLARIKQKIVREKIQKIIDSQVR
jgi:hypothetical protein